MYEHKSVNSDFRDIHDKRRDCQNENNILIILQFEIIH